MKQFLIIAALAALCGGCATSKNIQFDSSAEGVSKEISDLSGINWYKLSPPQTISFDITEKTQVLNQGDEQSPIVAFELETVGNKVDITLTSQIKKTVFSPKVLVLNGSNEVLKEIDTNSFIYSQAQFLSGDRLSHSFSVRAQKGESIRLLVMTDEKAAKDSTTVIHPAKLDAMAKGNYPPDIDDPIIPHSYYGSLTLELVMEEVVIEDADVVRVNQPTDEQIVSEADTVRFTPQAETQEFYYKTIKQAVKENNIPKALSLLDEAKALNIEGAQEVFIKALNER